MPPVVFFHSQVYNYFSRDDSTLETDSCWYICWYCFKRLLMYPLKWGYLELIWIRPQVLKIFRHISTTVGPKHGCAFDLYLICLTRTSICINCIYLSFISFKLQSLKISMFWGFWTCTRFLHSTGGDVLWSPKHSADLLSSAAHSDAELNRLR